MTTGSNPPSAQEVRQSTSGYSASGNQYSLRSLRVLQPQSLQVFCSDGAIGLTNYLVV